MRKKVWPCSDCHEDENEVFEVRGKDFCGDCLAERAIALEILLEEIEGFSKYQNFRINK